MPELAAANDWCFPLVHRLDAGLYDVSGGPRATEVFAGHHDPVLTPGPRAQRSMAGPAGTMAAMGPTRAAAARTVIYLFPVVETFTLDMPT